MCNSLPDWQLYRLLLFCWSRLLPCSKVTKIHASILDRVDEGIHLKSFARKLILSAFFIYVSQHVSHTTAALRGWDGVSTLPSSYWVLVSAIKEPNYKITLNTLL